MENKYYVLSVDTYAVSEKSESHIYSRLVLCESEPRKYYWDKYHNCEQPKTIEDWEDCYDRDEMMKSGYLYEGFRWKWDGEDQDGAYCVEYDMPYDTELNFPDNCDGYVNVQTVCSIEREISKEEYISLEKLCQEWDSFQRRYEDALLGRKNNKK